MTRRISLCLVVLVLTSETGLAWMWCHKSTGVFQEMKCESYDISHIENVKDHYWTDTSCFWWENWSPSAVAMDTPLQTHLDTEQFTDTVVRWLWKRMLELNIVDTGVQILPVQVTPIDTNARMFPWDEITEYTCPICKRRYRHGRFVLRCAVLHPEGQCCHMGEEAIK